MFENLGEFELGGKTEKPPEVLSRQPLQIQRAESLSALDLEAELLIQLQNGKQLLENSMYDHESSLAAKASTLNSISTVIRDLVKMQTEVWNAERLKALESCLISTLRAFPDVKESFLAVYDQALKDAKLHD